jgi:hypothetical protein
MDVIGVTPHVAAARKLSPSPSAPFVTQQPDKPDKYCSAADGYFALLQSCRGFFVLNWKVLPVLKLSVSPRFVTGAIHRPRVPAISLQISTTAKEQLHK